MYTSDALNFNFLRLSGKKEVLECNELKFANYQNNDGIYSLGLLSKKTNFEDILYSLKSETLYDTLKSEGYTKLVYDDIFDILEIFLRIFKFQPSSYINCRLKNYCFIKILLDNSAKNDSLQIDLLFKGLLFYNPSSEDFIDRNQLNNRKFFNDGTSIDFERVFEKVFEKIISLKNNKIDYYKLAKSDIELTYKILKEIINIIFNSETYNLPNEYLKFEKILVNENRLYFSLLKSIDYFTLINSNENNKIASLYYQSDQSLNIFNLAKRNSKIKFKSEYIIDSYIFKFSNNPIELIKFLTFLKESDYKKYTKFSIILLSHPFIIYNSESKKLLAGSDLIKLFPEDSYAYKKLKRYKEIFQ